MIPTVNCISKSGLERIDLLSYCFQEFREIYLMEEVTDTSALSVIAQLNYLDKKDKKDIFLYINSPGGSVSAGFSIVDAMKRCRCDVSTICTGTAASMGALILSCGTKGKRFATPLSEIMIHQPMGGAKGQASDIELVAQHISKTKRRLNQILAENTGQSMETVTRDCDRDYYMDVQEALEYGLIDHIMQTSIM